MLPYKDEKTFTPKMSELLYCADCGCTLEMYGEEEEGDEMVFFSGSDGEEKVLCENCYASKLQKK